MDGITSHGAEAGPHRGVPLWQRSLTWWRTARVRLENPVLGREMRGRMRGARSHLITGAYVLVVILLVLIVYGSTAATGGLTVNQLASRVGRAIWSWGCLGQAFLLPLMVPAFTCGAITLERERDMLELLLLTRQSASQICFGKLAGGVGLGLMLLLSSVPVLGLSLVLGGVSPLEIASCLAVLVSTVFAAGAVGLLVSSIVPKTVTASTVTYVLVGTGMFAPPFLSAVVGGGTGFETSELGMYLMLVAVLAATFPPAVGIATGLLAVGCSDWSRLARTTWIWTVGLCWAGLLGLLYLPGFSVIFLQSRVLLELVPPFAISSLMFTNHPAVAGFALGANLWLVCTMAQISIALVCFYGAVRRVRRMRAVY